MDRVSEESPDECLIITRLLGDLTLKERTICLVTAVGMSVEEEAAKLAGGLVEAVEAVTDPGEAKENTEPGETKASTEDEKSTKEMTEEELQKEIEERQAELDRRIAEKKEREREERMSTEIVAVIRLEREKLEEERMRLVEERIRYEVTTSSLTHVIMNILL